MNYQIHLDVIILSLYHCNAPEEIYLRFYSKNFDWAPYRYKIWIDYIFDVVKTGLQKLNKIFRAETMPISFYGKWAKSSPQWHS